MKQKVLFFIALLCMIAQGLWAQGIYKYIFCSVDKTTNEVTKSQGLHEANKLTSSTRVGSGDNFQGWWGVEGEVAFDDRIHVKGDTYLILCSGANPSPSRAPTNIFPTMPRTAPYYSSAATTNSTILCLPMSIIL